MIIKNILHVCMLIILPFIFLGIINRVKSFWAGRQGPSVFQPFKDFIRLLKKGEVISTTSSFIFKIAPSVTFASILFAGFIVPMVGNYSIISFNADFILFAYILAAGKFFSIIGAMDTGSSFEGMGASREALFSAMVEPAFFAIIASLSLWNGFISFEKLMILSHNNNLSLLILVLCVGTFLILVLTEGCRVPVDDPNTHLELTMIHEVMILDNSGPDLGLLMYGAGMKMVIFTALIVNIILPGNLPLPFALAGFLGIQLATAVVIGTIESVMARLRMSHVPQFLFLMTAISIIILSTIALFNSGGLK